MRRLTAAVQRGIQRHSPFLIAFTANWTFFADAGFQTSRNARSSSWPRRLHRILQSTSGTVSPPVPKHKLTHTRGDSAGTAARDARVHPPHASDDEGACRDAVMGRRHIVKVEDGSLQFDATRENVMSVLDWRLASGRYVSLLAEHLLAGDDVLSR